MRIVDIRERSISISRYADPAIPSGGLTTSLVAVTTDAIRAGRPVVGYGFASVGRFGQGGLIRERFAPRLLAAGTLADAAGAGLDPQRAWSAMMQGEKPGGHGERCVAVGTLDMAVWDAAAKIAEQPLHQYLAGRLGTAAPPSTVRAYAGGGRKTTSATSPTRSSDSPISASPMSRSRSAPPTSPPTCSASRPQPRRWRIPRTLPSMR